MANLYELNQNYTNLLEVLETATDENLIEMVQGALSEVDGSIKDKVDNCVRFVRNLDSDIAALKEEEKRLADKRKTIENSKKRMEQYLFDFTSHTEDKKLKGGIFELSVKKNPPSVAIEYTSDIPRIFMETVVTEKIDKAGLKKYLKDNEVPGVKLVQGESLKIK